MTRASRRAASAVGFGGRHQPITSPAEAPRPRMRLTSFKPVQRGALVGFANIRLPNSLLISDCTIWQSNGKAWASLPTKPVIGPDGRQVEIGGVKQRQPAASWPNRAIHDAWSAALVALVRERPPEAFEAAA